MEPINYYYPKSLLNIGKSEHGLKKKQLNDLFSYLNNAVLDQLPTPNQGNSRDSMRILDKKNVLIRIPGNEKERKHLEFRKEQMILGREVIIQNEFKHLTIPRASLVGGYLVEKLIPTIANGTLASIAYYVQNKQSFDQPVIELTKFLFKISLKDIVGNCGWMASNWPYGTPRYDNLLIYEKTKNNITTYKIALIDLETLSPQKFTHDNYLQTTKDIILLFPYHFELIIETCKKMINLSNDEIFWLNSFKESAENSIERVYKNHGNFVINNSILKVNPLIEFLNSPETQNQLIKDMRKEISTWNEESAKAHLVSSSEINLVDFIFRDVKKMDNAIVYLKVLGDNPEECLDFCEKTILYPILKTILRLMQEMIKLTKHQEPFSGPNILSERCLTYYLNPCKVNFELDPVNHHAFTVEELTANLNPNLIKPISPEICDLIVKSKLLRGKKRFEIEKLMLNTFMKRGFLADIFIHEKSVTILY